MASEVNASIPTVDLAPFFHEEGDCGRKKAIEIVASACRTYGFFRIVNHGVPLELMARAIELSKVFFDRSYEEKLGAKPVTGSRAPLPAGYARQPHNSPDKNECLLIFSPHSGYNVYPKEPLEFKTTLDECFTQLSKTAFLVEGILNEAMGLPPNFFKEYNKDRSTDIMVALRYFPATDIENNGITGHQDGNCLTFVFQDDIGGLEVLKDDEWIPADPIEGSIIVNIGDIIQVLSNNKFKSAMHRVVRKGRHRHSYAFFFNLDCKKWIEPLAQFTTDIGEAPKYKGFLYEEYLQLRMRNKTHPPSKPEDAIDILHYAIPD